MTDRTDVIDVIDLGVGQPDPAILPLARLRAAAAHALAGPGAASLQYGPEQGSPVLRGSLADLLSRHTGTPVEPAELLITAGASHGLDLVVERFAAPGATIFVEDPSYFFAFDVLRSRGARLVPVPTDRDGLDVEALERMLQVEVPAFVYTVPVFHNPTGVTLTGSRRRRLVELAQEYGFLVVADEVYQLLGQPGREPAPLRTFDAERVLSLGSFSKILGPGVRLGWIECTASRLARLVDNGVLRSGGGVSPIASAIVHSAISLGIQDEYLAEIRAVYERRRRHVVRLLDGSLTADFQVMPATGGLYVWLRLPEGLDATGLAAPAEAAGVRFRPGPVFSCAGNFPNYLRICVAPYDESRLTVAVQRLSRVLLRQPSRAGGVR
jgi:DNA-binding transcriptional MocR family regulator